MAGAATVDPAIGVQPANETLRALGAVDAKAGDVLLDVPDVAENGAVVPVSVDSRLPDVREIFLIVDSNPNPMVVVFKIPEGTDAFVSTRVKMADSGNVYAVVRSGGKLYSSCKSTKVTVGGCG
jgi:sulfur-oxidizing protein SoxY